MNDNIDEFMVFVKNEEQEELNGGVKTGLIQPKVLAEEKSIYSGSSILESMVQRQHPLSDRSDHLLSERILDIGR